MVTSKQKAITILGSTGSIGTQTLDIVTDHPDKFRVVGLAAGRNIKLLAEQIKQFKPEIVATSYPEKVAELKSAIADIPNPPQILAGAEGVAEVARVGFGRAHRRSSKWPPRSLSGRGPAHTSQLR